MKVSEIPRPDPNDPIWQQRKRENVRLGVIVGLIVLAVFLGSLWKYRPL